MTTTRAPHHSTAPLRITVRDLVSDRERFLVTFAGEPAALTYREFEALYLLASTDGRVARYETLAEALGGASRADSRRRLAVLISRLRSKLGAGATYLQNVRRVGYRLAPSY